MRPRSSSKLLACLFLLAGILIWGQACQRSDPSPATSSNTVLTIRSENLGAGTYGAGSDSFDYQLLKLTSPDGSVTYVQWFPPSGPTSAPAVLMVEPYAGIDWSGDAIDQAWATRPNASAGYAHADVNGPNYSAATGATINYQLKSPLEIAPQGFPFLYNKFGLMFVYGRFYAGGHLRSYYQAVAAALNFLGTQSNVDATRIGIFGISLGGFEAIFGAATSTNPPKYGVAWVPPADVLAEANYITNLPAKFTQAAPLKKAQDFFEPYQRRIHAAAGGAPGATGADYASLQPAAILPTLQTQFLVLHDDWDILVPVAIGRDFVSQAGAKAEGLWFPHASGINYDTFALDHSQPSEGMNFSLEMSFSYAYLLTRLASDTTAPLLNMYQSSQTAGHFSYFRAQQVAGRDVSTLVPRLIDLSDPRIQMLDLDSGTLKSGAAYVASVLQTHWGVSSTTVNESNVLSYLRANGLPH